VGRSKKKAKRLRAWVVFEDESGLSEKPSVRRTWAPRGHTPVIRHPFCWKKLSIASAIAYRWDGRLTRLYFRIIPGSFNDERLIQFVRQLRTSFRATNVILVWDGLPSHRSVKMKRYLEEQRRWLRVVRLPSYAPEVNPVESMWANISGQELANRSVDGLGDMMDSVQRGLSRVKSQRKLLQSFLRHAGIFF
jgi:hypothetical protein